MEKQIILSLEEYNRLTNIKLLEKKEIVIITIDHYCNSCKRKYIEDNRNLRKKLIMHGGCHDCVAPLLNGLGHCLDCWFCVDQTKDAKDMSILPNEPIKEV